MRFMAIVKATKDSEAGKMPSEELLSAMAKFNEEMVKAGVMLDGTPRLHLGNQNVYHYCGLATFGEYAVVPQESCIVIRRDVPLKVAALVGCAVATGVGAAFYTASVRPGASSGSASRAI